MRHRRVVGARQDPDAADDHAVVGHDQLHQLPQHHEQGERSHGRHDRRGSDPPCAPPPAFPEMQRSCEPRMTVASRNGCQQDHRGIRRHSARGACRASAKIGRSVHGTHTSARPDPQRGDRRVGHRVGRRRQRRGRHARGHPSDRRSRAARAAAARPSRATHRRAPTRSRRARPSPSRRRSWPAVPVRPRPRRTRRRCRGPGHAGSARGGSAPSRARRSRCARPPARARRRARPGPGRRGSRTR